MVSPRRTLVFGDLLLTPALRSAPSAVGALHMNLCTRQPQRAESQSESRLGKHAQASRLSPPNVPPFSCSRIQKPGREQQGKTEPVVNPTGERKTGTASEEARLSVTTACWAASLDLKLRSQSVRTPASGTFPGRDAAVSSRGQQVGKQAASATGCESGAAQPTPAHETRRAKGHWAARKFNRRPKLAA
jgi:hypothetical protein